MNVQVHDIYPQFSNSTLQRIKEQTASDPELNALKEVIHSGWPSTIQQVPVPLKPYWSFRDELAVEDGIAMKSHRIIIHAILQKDILTKLHAAHQGTEKPKLRARTSVYWRGLNKDIDEITKTCSTCQELHPSQQREPLIPTEVPPRAWHTIGTDLFTLEGSEYLVVADYYSKYPFVRQIQRGQSNSHTVVKMLRQIFSEQGIPKVLRSDNGPHYSGQAFQDFTRELGFQHVTSSPHYPRSNGFIESQVLKNHTHWSQTTITCWTTSRSSDPGQPSEENYQRCLKWSSHPQTRGEAGAPKVLPWQVCKATSWTNTGSKSNHPGSNDIEMETSWSERKACRSPPIIRCDNPKWKRAETH